MNALDVLCAQLTRDLFAIAKFLLILSRITMLIENDSRILMPAKLVG